MTAAMGHVLKKGRALRGIVTGGMEAAFGREHARTVTMMVVTDYV